MLFASGSNWVYPEDFTVIAESELLTDVESIEATAQRPSQLKGRKTAEVIKELNIVLLYVLMFKLDDIYEAYKL